MHAFEAKFLLQKLNSLNYEVMLCRKTSAEKQTRCILYNLNTVFHVLPENFMHLFSKVTHFIPQFWKFKEGHYSNASPLLTTPQVLFYRIQVELEINAPQIKTAVDGCNVFCMIWLHSFETEWILRAKSLLLENINCYVKVVCVLLKTGVPSSSDLFHLMCL